jgi:hypothetical protein
VQLGGVGALRNLVVLLCSMATLTYNLPPLDAAPALWQEVVGRVRWVAGCQRQLACAHQVVAPHLWPSPHADTQLLQVPPGMHINQRLQQVHPRAPIRKLSCIGLHLLL